VLTHLLDTDICIYSMKARDHELGRRLEKLEGRCAISDVSMFELYAGAERYDSPIKRIKLIEDFASRFDIVSFDTRAAKTAGPIKFKLESNGQGIGGYDMLIAGIALSRNLVLLSNNLREFSRVPGLLVESYVSKN
jgi:tRNA(fMet)-specific endonuclease VapC